jgi:hypothetical protein
VQLPVLNFPAFSFRTTAAAGGQSSKIFDIVRRKFVWLTPEEWVRQHLLHFLVNAKDVPKSLVSVEKNLKVNGLPRRTDVLVYSKAMKKMLLAECKAPAIKITQKVFDQAARYNLSLDVKYFVLTNGLQTVCCTMDHVRGQYNFLEEIPVFGEL